MRIAALPTLGLTLGAVVAHADAHVELAGDVAAGAGTDQSARTTVDIFELDDLEFDGPSHGATPNGDIVTAVIRCRCCVAQSRRGRGDRRSPERNLFSSSSASLRRATSEHHPARIALAPANSEASDAADVGQLATVGTYLDMGRGSVEADVHLARRLVVASTAWVERSELATHASADVSAQWRFR